MYTGLNENDQLVDRIKLASASLTNSLNRKEVAMTPKEAAEILQNNRARIPLDLWDALDALQTSDRTKLQFYVMRENSGRPVDDFTSYRAFFKAGVSHNSKLEPDCFSCWDGRWMREHPSSLRNFATHRSPSWRDRGHEIRRLTLEVTNNELIPEPKRR